MAPIRIALVGMGKIARDQHVPAIAHDPAFALVATASPNGPGVDGVPHFRALDAMLDAVPEVQAVALCTTPQVRYGLAAAAIARGLHVFLEKPPGATLSEVEALAGQARTRGTSLFASWHSRHAAGVAPAAAWLADRTILGARIVWREDVRAWHPGQQWIWRAGGLGVFDPGINALSIVTAILPQPFFLREATLEFPANRDAPIAARLRFATPGGATIDADLDWRQTGPQTWDIEVETDAGRCTLREGGARLSLPDGHEQAAPDREYPSLYAHFARLIAQGGSDVDLSPLRHVADAFLAGHRTTTAPFDDQLHAPPSRAG